MREIGRGGMGLVYLAEQPSLGRHVALKVITPTLAGDELFRQRFEREAHHAASIEHPNVIPIFEAGASGEHLYLAMRFVDGSDLGTCLRDRGPLEPAVAAGVMEQIGAALDAAHAKGLIHRDVKPANILLVGGDAAGHAYLTDFGLTKEHASETGLTDTGAWVGTVDYVAPEQIEGRRVDARTDVYALGCVLYEILTGQIPFSGTVPQKMWAHMNNPPPVLGEGVAVARAFDEVIQRGMAKKQGDRFPSAGDLGRAARAASIGTANPAPERSVATGVAAGGLAVTKPSPTPGETLAGPGPTRAAAPPPEPPTRELSGPAGGGTPGRSRGLVVAAVIAALAAGIAAAAFLVSQLDQGERKTVKTVQADADSTGSGESDSSADEPAQPPDEPATPEVRSFAPASYETYVPSDPTYYYLAELPKGNGWSQPIESRPTGGALLRTTVRGPEGAVLIIDRTPDELPQLGGDFQSSRSVAHPRFGSATEYVFSSSQAIPECNGNPCVDYLIEDGQGGGWGVLAGGPDQGIATEVASRVARSVTDADL